MKITNLISIIVIYSLTLVCACTSKDPNQATLVASPSSSHQLKELSTIELIKSIVSESNHSSIFVSAGRSTKMFKQNIPPHYSVKGYISPKNSSHNYSFKIGGLIESKPTYSFLKQNYQFYTSVPKEIDASTMYGGSPSFSLSDGENIIYQGFLYVPHFIELLEVNTPDGRKGVKVKWNYDATDKLGVLIDVVSYDEYDHIVSRAYDIVAESNSASYDISYLFARLGTEKKFAINIFRGNYNQFTDKTGNVYNLLVYSSSDQFVKFK